MKKMKFQIAEKSQIEKNNWIDFQNKTSRIEMAFAKRKIQLHLSMFGIKLMEKKQMVLIGFSSVWMVNFFICQHEEFLIFILSL